MTFRPFTLPHGLLSDYPDHLHIPSLNLPVHPREPPLDLPLQHHRLLRHTHFHTRSFPDPPPVANFTLILPLPTRTLPVVALDRTPATHTLARNLALLLDHRVLERRGEVALID